MADDLTEALAALNHVKLTQHEMIVEQPAQAPGHNMAVPLHHHGADAAFAQQDREANAVAGWMGMWAGALLLKDIVQDTIAESKDEDESKAKVKPQRHDCC